MDIREILKELRSNLGLSQDGLAEKLGVSQQFISQLETNESNLTSDTIVKFSDKLDVCPKIFIVCNTYKGNYFICNSNCDKCIYKICASKNN